jgi:hypothetical protein
LWEISLTGGVRLLQLWAMTACVVPLVCDVALAEPW